MIRRITGAWERYWFAPADPRPLGVCRIVFFGGLAVLSVCFAELGSSALWGDVSDVFWNPIRLFREVPIPVPSAGVLRAMDLAWTASLILACIGLWTRPATATAFLLGAYLLALPQNFGKIHHYSGPIVVALAIFAFSRCGDALSIDARRAGGAAPKHSGAYSWPMRLGRLYLILVYFPAGLAKLQNTGLDWASADTVVALLNINSSPLGHWIAQSEALCFAMAATVLALETASPLALFSRRAAAFLVPGLFFMQIGAALTMHVNLLPLLLLFVFWIVTPTSRRAEVA